VESTISRTLMNYDKIFKSIKNRIYKTKIILYSIVNSFVQGKWMINRTKIRTSSYFRIKIIRVHNIWISFITLQMLDSRINENEFVVDIWMNDNYLFL